MDLRQIEYFCKVGKLASFTRAAEQMYITQPSVTHAIQKLEEELGVQLFDRSKKKAVLTNEGAVILARMEKILDDLNQVIQEAKDFKNLLKGTVKIGVPPMIESNLFPDIFTSFHNAYPGLRIIAFEEGSSLAIATKLETGELDLAIMILPRTSETLNTLVITPEEFALCVHRNHPLQQQLTVSFDQLKNERFILLKEGSYQRQVVISRCCRHNFMPDITFSSSQINTIRELVANGSGISFLMKMVVRNDPKIAIVPLDEPILFDIGLAWKKESYLSNASLAFVKFIRQKYNLD